MSTASLAARSPVDNFFQFSLLGMVTAGYLAVAGSGYLDLPTLLVTAAALLLRALQLANLPTARLSPVVVTAITLAYFGFYPLDYFYLSRAFVPATVHLLFFVAVVKIFTANNERDYLYLKVIAFLELLAGCILTSNLNFFLFLVLFLLLAVATFASAEIRKSAQRRSASTGTVPAHLSARLTGLVGFVSVAILCITAGLFFFLPRTARAAFQHFGPHRLHVSGFASEVNLDQTGELDTDSTPMMRVLMDHDEDRRLGLKWRGTALINFNGRRWYNSVHDGRFLRPDPSGLLWLVEQGQRRGGERHISYAVHINDPGLTTLFFAGVPQFLRIHSPVVRYTTEPNGKGEVLSFQTRPFDESGATYQAFGRVEDPQQDLLAADSEGLSAAQRKMYLQLPTLDPRIPALARRVTEMSSSPRQQAAAINQYLTRNYAYTLKLPQYEAADPLATFLFERRKGHCEYFASAMAVMLRSLSIPARVVTGFQSGVFNPVSGWTIIRASDAHSWVEAYLPRRGWTTFDPTPPDLTSGSVSMWTKIGFYFDAAQVFWQDWVISYNLERQIRLATKVETSTRQARRNWLEEITRAVTGFSPGSIKAARPYLVAFFSLGSALLLLKLFGRQALAWWHTRARTARAKRGEASAHDATLLYEQMLDSLRRRGIEKPAWLTPQEFAGMLPQSTLSLLVEDFTSAYNALRFGGSNQAATRMVHILAQLESAQSLR